MVKTRTIKARETTIDKLDMIGLKTKETRLALLERLTREELERLFGPEWESKVREFIGDDKQE